MRIAIICNKTDNADQNAKHSGYHFGWGFEDLGDEVDFFHFSEQEKIDLDLYDFFMSVDSSQSYDIRDDIHPLVVYNGDTHMPGGIERDLRRCEHADIVFNGNVEHGRNLLHKNGIKAYWLPLGYDRRFEGYNPDISIEKDIDVSMVGHENSKERAILWNMLKSMDITCMVGDLSPDKYVEANTRARIVVNQPTEPWDNIYNNRMLEGMACCCMVLQKKIRTNAHRVLFREGVDFVVWDDFVDLEEKITYYLENDSERERIAWNGYEIATKNFQYTHLCRTIKNYIFNLLI